MSTIMKKGSVTLPTIDSESKKDLPEDFDSKDAGVPPNPNRRVILPDDQWKNPMFHRAPYICTCWLGYSGFTPQPTRHSGQ